jgi:hypothetical protein
MVIGAIMECLAAQCEPCSVHVTTPFIYMMTYPILCRQIKANMAGTAGAVMGWQQDHSLWQRGSQV